MLLSDFQLSPSLLYQDHTLIFTRSDKEEPVRIAGALGAALVCALLTGTEEAQQRGISITSDDERRAWIPLYEQEVIRDDWGTLESELQLLNNAYIDISVAQINLLDICPQKRLLDLAIRLMDTYMHYLVIEQFGEHIWDCFPWHTPFPQWLLEAAQIETRRQRFLHSDWTDPIQVTMLANMPDQPEQPSLVFINEDASDIMKRYLDWAWATYRTQLREIPGAKPDAASHRTFVVNQETNWLLLADDIKALPQPQQTLWAQWMNTWTNYVTRRIKPPKPIVFWTPGVSEKQQAQLTQFLRVQEKEWDYYKCLSAAVYALRQLGYVRRSCAFADIVRWLAEHMVNDYTLKNRKDQFRAAWNEHSRYSEEIRHYVNLLAQYGIKPFKTHESE